MSGFHRMITYLYLYEQGTKSRNIGFAKIERRDQRCLLEIHMKNTGCSLSPVPVFLYVPNNAQLAGILLGNFTLTRGSGDFKTVIDAENLKGSGYGLDDVKGIYIPLTAQMMSVSQWDDDEFDVTNFVELSENQTNGSDASNGIPAKTNGSDAINGIPAKTISSENDPPGPQKISVENAPALQAAEDSSSQDKDNSTDEEPKETQPSHSAENEMTAEKISAPVTTDEDSENSSNIRNSTNGTNAVNTASSLSQQGGVSASHQDKGIPKQKTTDALKALEALPRSAEQAAGFHTISQKSPQAAGRGHVSGHSPADEPENWDLRWRFILENYPVMTPFAGVQNTLCVRMELKDLRQLPKQFWYLGNNSFLLHGFFNYRYFILGMTEEFGVKKWFIGVPGVFQNPERVMAALFGFPEFRSEKPSPINTGEFGYWYRYLNELSEPSKK